MKKFTRFKTLLLLALTGLAVPASWGQLTLVKDVNDGPSWSYPDKLVNVNGVLFFTADDGVNGRELWKSDGTAAGTVLVKNIHPAGGSSPEYLTAVGNVLYFSADDGVNGRELWKSDGTSDGTTMVKDIHPDAGSHPHSLTAVNGTLYFQADNGLLEYAENNYELWKSDGTTAGTVLVKNINPYMSSSLSNLTAVGNTLFFVADDGGGGENYELWKSDGTAEGTVLVRDFTDDTSTHPYGLTAVGNTLFFGVAQAPRGNPRSNNLYKSDGTAEGTLEVAEINSGGYANINVHNLVNFNGVLYFSADNGTNGQELYKSDGTAAGTVLVKDIAAGGNGSFPGSLTVVGNTLYFQADDGTANGKELWKTDSTEAGTVLVKNIHTGEFAGSAPSNLVNAGGTLYFTADDGTHGEEVWKSNGTAAGTVLVMDLSPGDGGSLLQHLTAVGKVLFLAARSGAANSPGLELYRTAVPPPCDTRLSGAPTVPARACQGDGLPVTFATVGGCPEAPAETFRVELSNAVGSFAKPTNLGFAASVSDVLALPPGLPAGTGYRVRIVSGSQTSAASLPFKLEAPSLNVTPTVGGAPACRGGQVTVAFSLPAGGCPFPQGNAFTAQLSSATGNFNNPTTLGPVPSGGAQVTIPAGVATGSGYRIRVVSSSPALTSASSATFQIKACPGRLSAEAPTLVVNPNPATGGEIRVRVTGMDSPTFSLTSVSGRGIGVSEKTDGSGQFVLTPKQRLAPGVYLLQASEGQQRLTTRVLVGE